MVNETLQIRDFNLKVRQPVISTAGRRVYFKLLIPDVKDSKNVSFSCVQKSKGRDKLTCKGATFPNSVSRSDLICGLNDIALSKIC